MADHGVGLSKHGKQYTLWYNIWVEQGGGQSSVRWEVALWSEQADPAVLDARIWPRASAMAETLWSGNRDEIGKNRYAEATDRLNEWRYRMVRRGVGAESIQPLCCIRNPGMCNTHFSLLLNYFLLIYLKNNNANNSYWFDFLCYFSCYRMH